MVEAVSPKGATENDIVLENAEEEKMESRREDKSSRRGRDRDVNMTSEANNGVKATRD
jgi:hypothetical protein